MTCKKCGMTFPVISNRGDSEAVKFKAKRLGHEQGSTVDLPAYGDSTQSAVGCCTTLDADCVLSGCLCHLDELEKRESGDKTDHPIIVLSFVCAGS